MIYKGQLCVTNNAITPYVKMSKSLACNFVAELMFVIDVLILLTVFDTMLLSEFGDISS